MQLVFSKNSSIRIYMRMLACLVIFSLFISNSLTYTVFAKDKNVVYRLSDEKLAERIGEFQYENQKLDVYKFRLNTEIYNAISSFEKKPKDKIHRKMFFGELPPIDADFNEPKYKKVSKNIRLNDTEGFKTGLDCYKKISEKLPENVKNKCKEKNTIGFFWCKAERVISHGKSYHKTKECIGYIIIEWPEKSALNKDILNNTLKNCPNPETDELYYHEDDRYRGKAYEFAEKTKQQTPKIERWEKYVKIYQEALKLSKNSEAVQAQLDEMAEELKTAKENLIPKTEINSTYLYEMYNRYSGDLYWAIDTPMFYQGTSNDKKIDKTNTTPESLKRFNECIPKMKKLLDSLYDSENKPTNVNKASNTELIAEIEASLKETKAAYEALDRPIYTKKQLHMASKVWQNLSTLGNGFYDVEKVKKEDFTSESYENLKKACEEARKYCKQKEAPVMDVTPIRQTNEMIKLQDEVNKAYYNLREEKDNINIKLKVIDNVYYKQYPEYSTGDEFYSPYHFEKELSLGEKRTYDSVRPMIHSDFRSAFERSNASAYALFINGVFVESEFGLKSGRSTSLSGWILKVSPELSSSMRDICFRDGDEVVLARLRQPIQPNSTGLCMERAVDLIDLEHHIKTSKMKVPKEIVQGEEAEFEFEVAPASIMHERKGRYTPMSGAELYISPKASEDKAGISLANKATGAKTDYSGKLKYRFLDSGYYRISINPPYVKRDGDKDYMPGLICPSVEEIYVKPTNENSIEKIRREFLSELKAAYERYPEASYGSEDLTKLKELYNSGIEAVEKAEKLIDAAQEKERIIDEIYKIQEKNSIANDGKVEEFVRVLAPMPDDVSKFDKGQIHLMKKVIEKYDQLSSYQISLLLKKDKDKYDALKEAYKADGSTLPEPRKYKISYKIVGDNEEDTKVLEKLFELYEKEQKGKNSMLGAFRNTVFFEGHISQKPERRYKSVYTGEDYPLEQIMGVGVTIFYDNEMGKYAGQVEGAEYKPNGESAGLYIHGKKYNKVKIGYGNALKLPQKDGGGKFKYYAYMPYDDLEIILICSEDIENPSDAYYNLKKIAKDNIKSQFLKYKKEDYTDENWEKLVKAKDDVLKEIDDLRSLYNLSEYCDKALRVMAAVPRKTNMWEGTNPDENLSNQEIPDFGETVGRVHIIVENQTFKDSTAAWHGRLVDGWYELEERDTMMTSILKALQKKGCHWSTGSQGKASSWDDYTINYLASVQVSEKTKGDGSDFKINNTNRTLGEFSGTNQSGWMGTLNDWFTNEGFNQFSASSHDDFKKLSDGDEIHVMFTQSLGVDLGGSWGNSDTRLKYLEINGKGTLAPVFNPDIKEYVYALKENETSEIIRINPTAMNKNYLVGILLNADVDTAKSGYKRTSNIPVNINDVVNVVVGRYSWPSMNKQGAEARGYKETKYKINVIRDVTSYLNSSIISLPSTNRISLRNYVEYKERIDSILKTYENLSAEDKAKIKNIDVLKTFIDKVKFFEKISAVKAKLKVLPDAKKMNDKELIALKTEIEATSKMYNALSEQQKKYIVIADVANYNALIEKLKTLKVDVKAQTITGSAEAPVSTILEPKAEVEGGKAVAKLDEKAVKEALKEVAKSSSKTLIVIPEGTKDAKSIQVSIPKAAAQAVAEQKDVSVSIETNSGHVSVTPKAIESMVKEAGGSDIVIDISLKEKAEVKNQKANEQMKNKDAVAVEVTVTSNGKRITKFAGNLEILIPVNNKFVEGKSYTVTQILQDGTMDYPVGKCVKVAGKLYIKISVNHLSTFVVSPEGASDIPFIDIKGHWAFEAIKYVYANKLMSGVSEDKFAPDMNMSRAMLVTVLHRMDGSKKPEKESAFKDVEKGQWYTDAVAWASENGIVKGYSADTFGTNDNVTREQIATIMKKYADYKKIDTKKKNDLAQFSDKGAVSSWATDAMSWAVGDGLLTGRTTESLAPKGTASRAEVATILMRFSKSHE